jgi:hypothetical protein
LFPFRAHAWVEVEREIVCDSADFARSFVELARR